MNHSTKIRTPQQTIPDHPVSGTDDAVFFYGVLLAATSIVLGLLWDISWDASIGRDSFWSPPHIAVNFGAMLAWVLAAWKTIQSTMDRQIPAVGLGPFRTPSGAAFILWGGAAMLAAGGLNLWWTDAYGLFSPSWSPPHILVTSGVSAILVGTFLAAVARRDTISSIEKQALRKGNEQELRPSPSALWAGGLIIVFAATATLEYNLPNLQRTALFYTVSCAVYPLILSWIASTGHGAWPATASALAYTLFIWALVLIFPLFQATPLIGPVYHPVERMMPPLFPLLLIVPAFGMDMVFRRFRKGDWIQSALMGLTFVFLFMLTQWHFSAFLLSPDADNAVFAGGGQNWPFYMQVGPERTMFWGQEQSPVTISAVLTCFVLSMVSARIGRWLGRCAAGLRR
jgi:hypothetical protein